MNIYPSNIRQDEFNSTAEFNVYKHAIKSGIFDGTASCFLFHSVKNPTPGNFKLLGETDFIYLDREIILFIEVKGRQVKYDSLTNRWWVMDGTENKDPFVQVEENLFNYRDHKLPNLFNGKREIRNLIFGYSVFFPECRKPLSLTKHKRGTLEYDPELIVDYDDLNLKSFSKIIYDLKNYWKCHETYLRIQPTGISSRELFRIKNFIRKDIVFEFPWTDILKRNEIQYKRYTDQAQEQLLTMLEENLHMGAIVKGGPGTGKTWLALEQAKRLDINGKKVLFLCFNKNLAYYLDYQINILDAKNVKVIHRDAFYSEMLETHCGTTIETLKRSWELHNKTDEDWNGESIFWQREIPLTVSAFFKSYQVEKFDFIILDEAQDYFSEFHIDALDCFLKNGFESGRFLICMDNETQDLYLENTQEYEDYFRMVYPNYVSRLKRNCRNPQKLSDTAFFLTGIVRQECYFVEDVKNSEIKYYSTKDDLKNKLLSIIDQKKSDGIPLGKITILTYDANIQNIVIGIKPEVFTTFKQDSLFGDDKVIVSTAQAFKGLENQFILFIGPETYNSSNHQKKVIFNAFTRAQYQFIYFMNEKYRQTIDNEFANNIIDSHER